MCGKDSTNEVSILFDEMCREHLMVVSHSIDLMGQHTHTQSVECSIGAGDSMIFLSRYLSTSRSNDKKEVNSRTFWPQKSSSASKTVFS